MLKNMNIQLCFAAVIGFITCERILDLSTFGLEIDIYGDIVPFDNLDESDNRTIAAKPFQSLDRVLVCLNQEAFRQIQPNGGYDMCPKILTKFPNLNIEYHEELSCQNEIKSDNENSQTKSILSVVAPKPFKDLFSDIPMYFYDTLHAYEEADAFPNGLVPHQKQWHLLKHAFTHYIKVREWTRIAIISDNSPNSQEFENELVEEMKRSKLVFNVQGCAGERCNFRRALKFLKDHGAVIIIANVDAHASSLMETAHDLDMTSSQYLWLLRGPFEDSNAFEGSMGFQNYVSITLSPMPASNYPKYLKNKPHLNSIGRGLELLSTAVDSVKEKERIDWYYKSIFKKMNDTYYSDPDKATAFIRSGSSDCQMVFIEDSSIEPPGYTERGAPMYDLREYCLLRTESFTSPCSDTWAVLICIVWLMFILMVFLLVYFFNRCLVWI